jgi:regulator of replication initiation timing
MTREQHDAMKESQEEYDSAIRSEYADIIHDLEVLTANLRDGALQATEQHSADQARIKELEAENAELEKQNGEVFDDNHVLMVENAQLKADLINEQYESNSLKDDLVTVVKGENAAFILKCREEGDGYIPNSALTNDTLLELVRKGHIIHNRILNEKEG